MQTIETSDGAPAAVALLGAAGAVERATTLFLDRFGSGDEPLASHHTEIDQILAGQLSRARVTIEDVPAELVAVVDPDGRRYALLTVFSDRETATDRTNPLLGEPIDESPAIVWLKDMDGRYLRVNRSYTEHLAVDPEHVVGKTDADLSAKESIEGLRLRDNDPVPKEPLELEYTVAAFDDRPAFAVLRFALRDDEGKPIAVCGVAAPLAQARVARSECERLMKVERWSRLDHAAIREELLDEWELSPANGIPEVSAARTAVEALAGDSSAALAALAAERDVAVATAARLDQQLAEERQELVALREASSLAVKHADELLGAITAEQSRSTELEEALARTEARVEELTSALESERSAAERSGADAAQALGQERETMEALRQELGVAQLELERIRAEELGEERRNAEALRAELRAAHEETERARLAAAEVAKQAPRQEDLDDAKGQLAQMLDQLAAAKEELERAEEELERARADAAASAGTLEAEWETKETLQAELIASRGELEQLRVRTEEAEGRAEQAERRAEHADAAAEQARGAASAAVAALDEERGAIDALRHELKRANSDAATAAAALTVERETLDALHTELTAARAELGDQRERAERAESEASEERSRAEIAMSELAETQERAGDALGASERMQRQAAEAATELDVLRQTVEELRTELGAANEELDRLRAGAAGRDEPETEAEDGQVAAPASGGHTWTPDSQRTLSAALAGVSDWRTALKYAVKAIGTEGGWDAAIAWAPDDGRGPMMCAAMWTSDPARLGGFENLTWQHRLDASGTEFGRARNRPGPTCLLELQTADDRMLRMAAELGMGSALLLPIREGEKTIAILELLSHAETPPSSELMVSLEGVAVQLGTIGQLLSTTHWNLGSRL